MKWLIASDIHGSAYYCRKVLECFAREGAERLLLLGDVLYHGPRNDLPRDYAPKEVAAQLNAMADRVLGVRGNCDAEIDQAVLAFPIMADYALLCEGKWQQYFTERPAPFTREEKRAYLDGITGVSLGSDAFFPFGDNIERAHKSGVEFIAQAGGSVRDDHVIMTCDKYGIAMAFTGVRLFHH